MPLRFSDGALRLGASSDHALPRCLASGYPSVRRTGVKLCSVLLLFAQLVECHTYKCWPISKEKPMEDAEFKKKALLLQKYCLQ